MIALTRQAGKVQQECGLDILPDEFARGVLKWGLMEVWLSSIQKCHFLSRETSLIQCKANLNNLGAEKAFLHWGDILEHSVLYSQSPQKPVS